MRFVLEADTDIFKSNPELSLTTHLKELSNKELKWIVLVYDYESPLSQMPLEVRKQKAGTMTGWLVEGEKISKKFEDILEGKNIKVLKGVAEYNSLQFDENHEALIAYNEQLKQYRTFLKQKQKKPSELKIARDLMKDMPLLLKARDDIAKLVTLRAGEDDFDIADLENLSTIDKVILEEEKEKDNEY